MSKESIRNHLERHQAGSSSQESREGTLDVSQLTWVRKASRTSILRDEEIEAMAARMAKLKES
jgi:hypothetical protein